MTQDFRETLARELCRQNIPWNWQGRNRDAWVEIEWRGYLTRADAILAMPVVAKILKTDAPTAAVIGDDRS